jgi:hypothetical protein
MRAKSLVWPLLIGILLALSALACNYFAAGEEVDGTTPAVAPPAAAEDSATAVDLELQEALAAEVVDDRPEVLGYLGRPDAFTISIVTVENVNVRMESWRYYQFGTRVDFVDGEAAWTMEIDPAPDGAIFPAWFDPLAFQEGMTAAEAARAAAAASPADAEPEMIDLASGGEDLIGGVFLVGDQILIGLEDDRLVYVETMGLFPADGEP